MTETKTDKVKKPMYWLIYVSLLLSGLLLLADAYQISHLYRWTARLGIALVFSAFSLFIANGRKEGITAVVIIWVAVICTYFL